jgi:hypothetical protein
MVNLVPPDIFVPNQTLELVADPFNHCSSICPYEDGILITWYSGQGECRDDQSVYLLFIQKNGTSVPLRLGDRTGNPVLWRDGDHAYLLWSHFEDSGYIKHLADRWKYCSNWIMQVEVKNNQVSLVGKTAILRGKNLLGRCRPVEYEDKIYLPMYDELDRHGVIVAGRGLTYRLSGKIGRDMIQPTLWVQDGKLCSLSRTFHSAHHFSQYSESSDGRTWSEPILSSIPNRNSSLHVLTWHGYNLLIWNDTDQLRRRDLTIGILDGLGVCPLFRLAAIGSYPSMCEDREGNLCLSYTNSKGAILYHAWYKDRLLAAIRGRDFSGTRGGEATLVTGRETPSDTSVL